MSQKKETELTHLTIVTQLNARKEKEKDVVSQQLENAITDVTSRMIEINQNIDEKVVVCEESSLLIDGIAVNTVTGTEGIQNITEKLEILKYITENVDHNLKEIKWDEYCLNIKSEMILQEGDITLEQEVNSSATAAASETNAKGIFLLCYCKTISHIQINLFSVCNTRQI